MLRCRAAVQRMQNIWNKLISLVQITADVSWPVNPNINTVSMSEAD